MRRFASVRPLVVVAALASLLSSRVQAAPCTPATCTGTFRGVTFEALAPGSAVEGAGTLHPDLTVTSVPWSFGAGCPTGVTRVIEEGNPLPFGSYSTASGFDNGCLDGLRGMGHPANCVLDYDFTFAPGVTVGCFSIKLFDFGDYYPYGGAVHGATLTAYDATHAVVGVATLGGGAAVDSSSGDACLSQAGMPGNFTMAVSGTGITRLELRFGPSPDPNIGFDTIAFCELTAATPTRPRSWGRLKTHHR
ncbi:MAG: hypothetical protein U0704_16300 [Candidatus Eisenbacteria bacterium]